MSTTKLVSFTTKTKQGVFGLQNRRCTCSVFDTPNLPTGHGEGTLRIRLFLVIYLAAETLPEPRHNTFKLQQSARTG